MFTKTEIAQHLTRSMKPLTVEGICIEYVLCSYSDQIQIYTDSGLTLEVYDLCNGSAIERAAESFVNITAWAEVAWEMDRMTGSDDDGEPLDATKYSREDWDEQGLVGVAMSDRNNIDENLPF